MNLRRFNVPRFSKWDTTRLRTAISTTAERAIRLLLRAMVAVWRVWLAVGVIHMVTSIFEAVIGLFVLAVVGLYMRVFTTIYRDLERWAVVYAPYIGRIVECKAWVASPRLVDVVVGGIVATLLALSLPDWGQAVTWWWLPEDAPLLDEGMLVDLMFAELVVYLDQVFIEDTLVGLAVRTAMLYIGAWIVVGVVFVGSVVVFRMFPRVGAAAARQRWWSNNRPPAGLDYSAISLSYGWHMHHRRPKREDASGGGIQSKS